MKNCTFVTFDVFFLASLHQLWFLRWVWILNTDEGSCDAVEGFWEYKTSLAQRPLFHGSKAAPVTHKSRFRADCMPHYTHSSIGLCGINNNHVKPAPWRRLTSHGQPDKPTRGVTQDSAAVMLTLPEGVFQGPQPPNTLRLARKWAGCGIH